MGLLGGKTALGHYHAVQYFWSNDILSKAHHRVVLMVVVDAKWKKRWSRNRGDESLMLTRLSMVSLYGAEMGFLLLLQLGVTQVRLDFLRVTVSSISL